MTTAPGREAPNGDESIPGDEADEDYNRPDERKPTRGEMHGRNVNRRESKETGEHRE